jgi:hypothetical protein
MLIKVHYSGGYTDCVDSRVLASVSWTDYANFQFQGDEYSLKCESIEIDFCSNLVQSSQNQIREVPFDFTPLTQGKKSLQRVARF